MQRPPSRVSAQSKRPVSSRVKKTMQAVLAVANGAVGVLNLIQGQFSPCSAKLLNLTMRRH